MISVMDLELFIKMKLILNNYKIPSWNILYSGKHWTKRQELKEDAKYAILEALNGKRVQMYSDKVSISIIGHFVSPLDSDNICSKIIIDSLKGSVIKNDTIKYVGSVTVESVKDTRNFTEIIINAVDK